MGDASVVYWLVTVHVQGQILGTPAEVSSAPRSPLYAGTCALTGAAAASAATYSGCAGAGGAVVASGAVADASRALFTYTNATCSYPSAYPTLLVQTRWLRPRAQCAACTLPTTVCRLSRPLERILFTAALLGCLPGVDPVLGWLGIARARVVARVCLASAQLHPHPLRTCCTASRGPAHARGDFALQLVPTRPAQPRTADAAAAHGAGERADWRGARARAAISTQQVCTSVGGRWAAAACKVGTAPLCAGAGGAWSPRRMWSLEGGVDMLIVGLLQGCGGYPFFDPCAPPAGPSRTPPPGEGGSSAQRRVTGGVCCCWSGCGLDNILYGL